MVCHRANTTFFCSVNCTRQFWQKFNLLLRRQFAFHTTRVTTVHWRSTRVGHLVVATNLLKAFEEVIEDACRESRAGSDQSHMMSVVRSSVHARCIVEKAIGTARQKPAKVRVTRLVWDPY